VRHHVEISTVHPKYSYYQARTGAFWISHCYDVGEAFLVVPSEVVGEVWVYTVRNGAISQPGLALKPSEKPGERDAGEEPAIPES